MAGILIAIRNFTIALLLAWMGFSVSPDSDERGDNSSAAPNSSMMNAIIG